MDWITIQTYTYAHDAHLDELLLKSEGVETFLKDEFTNQIDNFMSNAIGGVKLQVLKKDEFRAKEILSIQTYEPVKEDMSSFISSIIAFANKLPLVRHLDNEKKVGITLVIIVTVVTVVISALYFAVSY